MNKFVNTKTGKLYTAYSIREIGDKYVVVFKKGGKEYTYDRYTGMDEEGIYKVLISF